MLNHNELELREHLAATASGRLSLQEFREWFGPVAWEAESAHQPTDTDLIDEVELLLAEFDNGDWSELELADAFDALSRTYRVPPRQPRPGVQAGSLSATVGRARGAAITGPLVLVGTPREAGFA